MGDRSSVWRRRLKRLREICGDVTVTGPSRNSERPLLALTSSRLGRDARLHQAICRSLRVSIEDCERESAEILVASGSAIEPWAKRAASFFGVTCRTIRLMDDGDAEALYADWPAGSQTTIDAVAIALADRVDAHYVRRGGEIASCLQRRLRSEQECNVRVTRVAKKQCAATELIAAGAKGWAESEAGLNVDRFDAIHPTATRFKVCDASSDGWAKRPGRWLVHCTRRCDGPWPFETLNQYRDSMLMGTRDAAKRGPLDALLRILRSRRLLAGAIASDRRFPVVCFSSLSLQELMRRRCFRPHLGRWDYEPHGIAIRISAARKQGVHPVIYGDRTDRKMLDLGERYRFQSTGKTYDWRQEREWRSPQTIDLDALPPRSVRVFALSTPRARSALRGCPWPITFLDVAQDAE